MQVFKCDGHNCKSENHELEVTNWLTIGSADGGSLFMKNQLPGNQFSVMSNYGDLHFCSIPCFIGKFFEDKEKAVNEGCNKYLLEACVGMIKAFKAAPAEWLMTNDVQQAESVMMDAVNMALSVKI